jgi:hypothetical protein
MAGQHNAIRRFKRADLAPFVEPPPVVERDADAPAALRTKVRRQSFSRKTPGSFHQRSTSPVISAAKARSGGAATSALASNVPAAPSATAFGRFIAAAAMWKSRAFVCFVMPPLLIATGAVAAFGAGKFAPTNPRGLARRRRPEAAASESNDDEFF